MTPVFSPPLVSALPAAPFRPAAQAIGFDALLSVSSGPVVEPPAIPAAHGEPIRLPPVAPENEAADVIAPAAEIDANILPLLAAYGGSVAPAILAEPPRSSISDDTGVADEDSEATEPALREPAEILASVPVVVATPIASPAIGNITTIAAAVKSPASLAVKTNPPVKLASATVSSPPVIEPDVEPSAGAEVVSVPPMRSQLNAAPHAPQLMPDAPHSVASTGIIPVADSAGLFASAPAEGNIVSAVSVQVIAADHISDVAARPATDVSNVVAERALDVARGSLWLDQLAGDIAAVQDSERDLTFRLIPAQLGQLDVKIATRDDGMQLSFRTQTEDAAGIIATAQPRLVEELKAQGVRIAGSEVHTGSGQSSFAQQNGRPHRLETIAEFERPSSDFQEPTHATSRQNGRFA
jgi:flagellar hook-length control protein FliK